MVVSAKQMKRQYRKTLPDNPPKKRALKRVGVEKKKLEKSKKKQISDRNWFYEPQQRVKTSLLKVINARGTRKSWLEGQTWIPEGIPEQRNPTTAGGRTRGAKGKEKKCGRGKNSESRKKKGDRRAQGEIPPLQERKTRKQRRLEFARGNRRKITNYRERKG